MRHAGTDFRVIIQHAAHEDSRRTHTYLSQYNPHYASELSVAVTEAFRAIAEAPFRWAEIALGVRKFLLETFPYAVYYRVRGSTVIVLRVLDQRRHPDTWRRRP